MKAMIYRTYDVPLLPKSAWVGRLVRLLRIRMIYNPAKKCWVFVTWKFREIR